jgi:hypothetical protein
LPIAEDKWVAVSLEFPNEKDFWFLVKKVSYMTLL